MSGTRRRKGATKGKRLEGSRDAKRLGSVILEVLSGLRTPSDACAAVGISLQRYYVLETRAVQGLVLALEPLPRGKRRKPEDELARVAKERDRLERELRRAQALVRVAQRSVGLPPPPSSKAAKKQPGKGKRRKRKPTVRARKAITRLQSELEEPSQEATSTRQSAVSPGNGARSQSA